MINLTRLEVMTILKPSRNSLTKEASVCIFSPWTWVTWSDIRQKLHHRIKWKTRWFFAWEQDQSRTRMNLFPSIWITLVKRSSWWKSTNRFLTISTPFVTRCTAQSSPTLSTWWDGPTWYQKTWCRNSTSFWLTPLSPLVKSKEEHGCHYPQVMQLLLRSHLAKTKPKVLKVPSFTGPGKSRTSLSKIQRALSRVEITQTHLLRSNSGRTKARTLTRSVSNWAPRESRRYSNSSSRISPLTLDHSASFKRKYKPPELSQTRTISIFRLFKISSTSWLITQLNSLKPLTCSFQSCTLPNWSGTIPTTTTLLQDSLSSSVKSVTPLSIDAVTTSMAQRSSLSSKVRSQEKHMRNLS